MDFTKEDLAVKKLKLIDKITTVVFSHKTFIFTENILLCAMHCILGKLLNLHKIFERLRHWEEIHTF